MKKIFCLFLVFIIACSQPHKDLRNKIVQLSEAAQGTVGVSIKLIETGDTLSQNGTYHSPMQSVFKFPIALAILDQVDKGKLSLNQRIPLSKQDVADTTTWSPMRDTYPKGDTTVSLDDMLHFMVSHSDNIACDKLIALLGGPSHVNDFIHGLGINGIAIVVNEKQMHSGWDVQYQNWCEPNEMTHLLELFYNSKCVSKSSTDYLMKIMDETSTSAKRIKGLLPGGTIVARKSGSGPTKDGLTSATNDVGIITLPDGNHLIISAFVSDSKATDTTRDAVIARITKAAWGEFQKKN
jgi:beta-lactamase class A